MGQARQDAETTLLDESNSARVKLSPRELDRLYLVDGHKPSFRPVLLRFQKPDHGSNSHPISIDNHNENYFYRGSALSGRTALNLVQGAKRRSLEPSATMIFSCESDEDDYKLPPHPRRRKGLLVSLTCLITGS